MRQLFFLISLIFCNAKMYSQDDKISIAVPNFAVAPGANVDANTAEAIHQRVIDALVKNKKITVVERGQMDVLSREIQIQRSESFMDGNNNVADKIRNTGANYLLTGVISRIDYSQEQKELKQFNVKTYQMEVKERYTAFYCMIELNLKLIDISTGQIALSEVIAAKNRGGQGGGFIFGKDGAANNENAYSGALDDVTSSAGYFCRKAFPVNFKVVEITEKDRKGNAKSLLILGDESDYLREGQMLSVKVLTELDMNGKKIIRKKELGEAKISKLEEGGFINVKIKKGEEEITKAIDSKQKIEISDLQ
jgi:curli biogenesis system outer membrane secretion channel CsgG